VCSNDGGPGGDEEQEMMVLSPGTEEEMEVWGYQTSNLKSVLLMLGRYLYRDSPTRVSVALFLFTFRRITRSLTIKSLLKKDL
jgi:hypothetical protein